MTRNDDAGGAAPSDSGRRRPPLKSILIWTAVAAIAGAGPLVGPVLAAQMG